ncbi:F-box protein At1g30200-like [Rhodamnia argentea]|uniref:F-box protein At1g30200-like n=1 Tax=Rhodamnia argentea TaxID=178133 RepID=A0A8B8NJ73_9MYRT|nr:F-box protein At1g30200-like [Rhodamnia argentea]
MIQKLRADPPRGRVGPDDNRFDLLPDALLLLIFSKVADLNTLVLCSSVCKRFRLLVPQIDTVSLRLDYFDRDGSARGSSVRSLRRIFKSFGAKLIGPRSSASVCCSSSRVAPYDQLSHLRHRFRELVALRVELRNSTRSRRDDAVRNSLTWWKAVFGSRLETCVVLSAASICRTSAGASCGVGRVRETMSESDLKSILEMTKCSLVNASFRLVYFVPRDHGRLRSVVVSDDAGRGKLCMGEEELASFNGSPSSKRNSAEELRSQRLRSLRGPLRMNVWYVPVLDLPASGRCMRRVKIAAARREDNREIAMERDAELLIGGFRRRRRAREGLRRSCGGDDEKQQEEEVRAEDSVLLGLGEWGTTCWIIPPLHLDIFVFMLTSHYTG